MLLFLHNKEIDHLYSFQPATTNWPSTFAPDSIRMRSNLGLTGKAFTTKQICIEKQLVGNNSLLIPEEKDLSKLKPLKCLKNALAIPLISSAGSSLGVIQVYNLEDPVDNEFLKSVA